MISNLTSDINNSSKKIILLDRDGTIIENIPYLDDEKKIKFIEDAIKGLIFAQQLGFSFIVISNQSGIGRGYVSIEKVNQINLHIGNELLKFGINLSEYIFCPHVPDDNCLCRKPKSEMILEVIRRKKVNKNNLYFIGDMITDIKAAENAGVKSYLISAKLVNLDNFPLSTWVPNFSTAIKIISHKL